ncbi:peptidoglycan-associated lipoprotein [Thalassobaculum fulvum]|jgi:peptidoglycan-associated lipoprotein|uniref:Peptidoglycan-associated lipoprotein n=1 Tax=Thalassobaculum fulvum TaxID=1633335 RepID=A0A918XXB0_9PROT|nr:peptidoglycan-associated lipoprotein Pal [Thalassobaculum fulvum]GHD63485.1 peptidoglycan-associated lipoprotein [Thalassobaculum fulvum]
MRMKLLSVFAVVALLAACETAPTDGQAGAGTGGVQSTTAPAPAPAGPTPGTNEDFVVNVGDRVFFAFDSSELTAEARTTLEKQAFWLRKYPQTTVTLEGHCDERGTREYNLALGERRAAAARDYMVSLGVDPSRVTTISYGKERPAVLGSNEEAWAQNRRSVTVIN